MLAERPGDPVAIMEEEFDRRNFGLEPSFFSFVRSVISARRIIFNTPSTIEASGSSHERFTFTLGRRERF
jgi:hypothetical protein